MHEQTDVLDVQTDELDVLTEDIEADVQVKKDDIHAGLKLGLITKNLKRNAMELKAVYAEAGELIAEMEDLADKYYRKPQLEQNHEIIKDNSYHRRSTFANTGHVLIGTKYYTKDRDGWEKVMCFELRMRDMSRLNKTTKKKAYHFDPDKKIPNSEKYYEIPKFATKYENKSENKIPYKVLTHPFSKSQCKKYMRDWELKLFLTFKQIISPTTRRYLGLRERYKTLREERRVLLSIFIADRGLPLSREYNRKIGELEKVIADHYPELINL